MPPQPTRPHIEPCDPRILLSNDFANLTPDGVLHVRGTSAADLLYVKTQNHLVRVELNAQTLTFTLGLVEHIEIDNGAGDDRTFLGGTNEPCYAFAGDGNDFIMGGGANDTLTGGAGKDSISGAAGDDRLSGSGGHDLLAGEGGNDRLYGGAGNDTLSGGSGNDRLWGDTGSDYLAGQGNADRFYADDGERDTIEGGGGTDMAIQDEIDLSDAENG
jgi:Ca2+-binding RTX toxin-like protein